MASLDEGVTVGRAEERGRVGSSLAVGVRRMLLMYAPLFAVAFAWCVARAAGYDVLTVLGWLPGAVAMGLSAWYLHRASRVIQLGDWPREDWARPWEPMVDGSHRHQNQSAPFNRRGCRVGDRGRARSVG
jgi:hypothetical protein